MVTLNLLSTSSGGSTTTNQSGNSAAGNICEVRPQTKGVWGLLIGGTTFLLVAVAVVNCSFYDLMMNERTQMRPGLPAYDMWINPVPEVLMSVHIFTIENPDEFLAGTDTKLRIKDLGPIVYREHLRHTDIVFHPENSTMTYTANRVVEFVEDYNEPGILNRSIIVPNFAALGAAASMADSSFIVKYGFKLLHRSTEEPLFLNMTVYNFLWNYRSSLVMKAKSLVPFMVPIENSGMLHIIYTDFSDRYNVRIGAANDGPTFFQINSINGRTTVPAFRLDRGECDATVINSTEGVVYGQHITKDTVLHFWRRSMCRTVPLHFERTMRMGHLDGYKFLLGANVYDRFDENSTAEDCYRGNGYTALPDGLSDLSKCYYDIPFVASNPHFWGREEVASPNIVGLHPERELHQSYSIIEPKMGIPIDQCAKTQSNLMIPNLYGFGEDYHKFSNMVLPLMWIQYHQRALTSEITALLLFVNWLSTIQIVLTVALFVGATIMLSVATVRLVRSQQWDRRSPKNPMSILKSNAHHIVFETETFLGKNGKQMDVIEY